MKLNESQTGFFDKKIMGAALWTSLYKLNPRELWHNPVILVAWLCAACVTVYVGGQILTKSGASAFEWQIMLWLWLTVVFANFSESLAEGRGKAQADALKKLRVTTVARLVIEGGERKISATELKPGDRVVCEAGDVIPMDGDVVEGVASVDEAAITGESAPVIRESGGDRCGVTGGTRVLSDRIIVQITARSGESFLDRMVALIESAKRQKTPNELALQVVLVGLTVIFVFVVVSLKLYAIFLDRTMGENLAATTTLPILMALLVCLIPTTIGGLISAIGISGMDRLLQKNVVAKSGRAVEAAGDVNVLLLDKTGTITYGNRMATGILPAEGVTHETLARAIYLASLSDETPEGRSVVSLLKGTYASQIAQWEKQIASQTFRTVPFSAFTRMSGVDFILDGRTSEIRKGAADAIKQEAKNHQMSFPHAMQMVVETIAKTGGTPLVVSENGAVLGVIHLKDVVKPNINTKFAELRRMGIRSIMITGDNALTAATIAAEAGVDDFMAQATPEDKLKRIRDEQAQGHMVAMAGDGTNDAPALAQADIGVSMSSGTQAAREAGNMVDMDSDPTKLITVVETGKQLLVTRGSLTTFSIANDVAKYFAIIPALFGALYGINGGSGPLAVLDVMALHSPQSGILSAVIFNALVILFLIPLALRGVKLHPESASRMLLRNVVTYGLGGVIAPFAGIKLIDLGIGLLGFI